ncbi:MAG: hypothetical protein JWO31_3283 [Phycisphaerales bacterium]|nr:hypothetical protein [Phycisphaerales bacterium]
MQTPVYGTIISYASVATYDGEGATFTPFAKLRSITPPKPEAEDIDITNSDSPDSAREFEPGLFDPGETEFTILYNKAVAVALYALFRVPKGFRIEFPDGSGWLFNGYVKSIGDEGDLGDVYETTITIKISGKPAKLADVTPA